MARAGAGGGKGGGYHERRGEFRVNWTSLPVPERIHLLLVVPLARWRAEGGKDRESRARFGRLSLKNSININPP